MRASETSAGIRRCYEPRARWRPDAIVPLEASQRFPERRRDLRLSFLAFLPCQADDLAGRPERHRKRNGVVHVAADADVAVVALEGDPLESRGPEHPAHHVR